MLNCVAHRKVVQDVGECVHHRCVFATYFQQIRRPATVVQCVCSADHRIGCRGLWCAPRESKPSQSDRLDRRTNLRKEAIQLRRWRRKIVAGQATAFYVHLKRIQICRVQQGDGMRCRRTVENQRRIESSSTPRAISASSPNPTTQSTVNIRGVTQTCTYQHNTSLQI